MTEAQYYIRMIMILTANVSCILLSFRRGLKENLRMIASCIGILALMQVYRILTGDPLDLLNFMPGWWFLPSLFFIHRGSMAQKIFVTFTILAIAHVILVVTSFIAMDDITLRIILLGCGLCAYAALVAWQGHKFIQRVFSSAGGSWWGYAAYITVFYLLMTEAYGLNLTLPEGNEALRFFYLLPAFAFAGLVLFFVAILRTHEKTAAILELDMARQILDSGRSHYKNLTETIERVRIMQHDYRHQLAVLSGLKGGELRKYLDSVISHYSEQEAEAFAQNPVIDALLNHYAARIRAEGISFSAEVHIPLDIGVDNYDLCIVLGNLLDNALTAAKKTDGGYVRLEARQKEAQMIIRVSNSYSGEVLRDEHGRLLSSREGGGSGSRSVRTAVRKYGGIYENEWENGEFGAYVLLSAGKAAGKARG